MSKETINALGREHVKTNILNLRASGFSEDEIYRAVIVRKRYEDGEYSDETLESKRLSFGQWLYEHGRINEGEA